METTIPTWPATDLLPMVRELDLTRVDAQRAIYLDYTGAALYPESLVRKHARLLRHRVVGNPHSESTASRVPTEWIARARRHVLRFFDADPAEYAVCFTANASAALRLVGESFRFDEHTPFAMTADNHNSVVGIANSRGAPALLSRCCRSITICVCVRCGCRR